MLKKQGCLQKWKDNKKIYSFLFIIFIASFIGCKTKVFASSGIIKGTVTSTINSVQLKAEEIEEIDENDESNKEPEQAKSESITINASFGYEKHVKYGRYMRVLTEITNAGEDFTGEIQLIIPDGENRTLYARDVSIAAGESKSVSLCVPVNSMDNQYTFQLTDSKKEVKIKKDVKAIITSNSQLAYMGVLSDSISELSYLRTTDVKMFGLSAKTFPESFLELDTLDIIVINDFDTSVLNEKQYKALKEWVSQGGTLVLGTGATGQKTLQLFQDNFIAGKVGTLDKDNILDIKVEGATVLTEKDTVSIHQKISRGLGNVQIFGTDLSVYNSDKSGIGKETAQRIVSNLSEAKEAQLLKELEVRYGNNSLYNAIGVSDLGELPTVGRYAVILIFYVILVGPILYFVLKKVDKRNYTWLAVPILSVLFALTIYMLGSSTRINKPYVGYVSFIKLNDSEQQTAQVETYFSVTAPSNADYQFELTGEKGICSVKQDDYYLRHEKTNKNVTTYIKYGNDKTSILLSDKPAFIPSYFRIKETQNIKGTYEHDIILNNSKLTGSFTNNLGFTLDNTVIYSNHKIANLGTIKDKESVKVEEKNSVDFFTLDSLYTSNILSSIMGGYGYNPELNADDQRKEYTLEYYLQDKFGDISNDSFLIGFLESNQNETMQEIGFDYNGVTAIIIPLVVPSYITGQEVIADINQYGTVTQGYYDRDYRYMDGTNLVMEYEFPKEDKLVSILYLDEVDQAYDYNGWNRFEGKIMAYNYETKEYDILFADEESGEWNNLKPYINENNSMILSYEAKSSNMIIPILAVVKEEK